MKQRPQLTRMKVRVGSKVKEAISLTEKIYVVTDLGPGDGGKGGVIHKLASFTNAHTVIKRGGAQGSHGVRTSHGESFNFSQWGCGTLEGIPTFMSEQFIVSPDALLNEADALRYECGIHNPFNLMSSDENALCATPFHRITSHVKELALGNNPRGTIGTGVGEAYRDYQTRPELAIMVRDLYKDTISDKLRLSFEYQREKLLPIVAGGVFLSEDFSLLGDELQLLHDDGLLEHTIGRFKEVSELLRVESLDEVLSKEGSAVVECSHGVLNDSETGFKPHVSAIRILPIFPNNMLVKAGFEGKIVNLGIMRAYAIRHGAGPLPTADEAMLDSLLPGSNKAENRWQGKVRVGPLDFVQIRRAIEVCRPIEFDGLAITWFDQITKNGRWDICDEYIDGVPSILSIPIHEDDPAKLLAICAQVMQERLNIPVRMVSFGPTEVDKVLL